MLLSGIEMEFLLRKDGKPLTEDPQIYSLQQLSKMMPLLARVEQELCRAGVNVISLENEYAAGTQLKTLSPQLTDLHPGKHLTARSASGA